MGENIGSAARAMKNFGLCDLRLVAPRDGWPNPLAVATSVGASDLLDSARLCSSLAEATADLTHLYAATARRRFMHKDYVMTRDLKDDYAEHFLPSPGQHGVPAQPHGDGGSSGESGAGSTSGLGGGAIGGAAAGAPRIGLMFGRESSGLTNEEVAMAGKIVVVDSDPDFAVLNLAQAVLVCCYELYPLWRRELRSPSNTVSGATPAAAKGAPGRRSSAAADSGSICDADNPGYETSGSSSDFDFDHLRGADGYGSFGGSSDGSGGDGGSIRGGGVGGVEDTLGSLQGPAAASTGAVSSGLASRPDLANAQELASMADSEGFLQRLFAELDAAGYFEVETRKPSTQANIRNLLRRVPRLSKQEVATLHGMISKLVGQRGSGRRR